MILINTDNKLSDKTTLKNVVILLPDVFADDSMFFPQVFFRSCIIWSINRIQNTDIRKELIHVAWHPTKW